MKSHGGNRDAGGVCPQVFQPVELPRLLIEEMHDDVSTIHQDPLRFVAEPAGSARLRHRPLGVPDGCPLLLQGGFKMVLEGVDLPTAASRADHEEIGDRGEGMNIQDEHILGLLLEDGLGSKERLRLAIQSARQTLR